MPRRTAFTLVELLVIAAILAILAATLFPVFAKARGSARTATAMTEFKRTGLAFGMYAQDYDEAFPRTQAALRTAGFKASPKFIVTGCIDETNPNWQSLNGGCQDVQANLVWSRTSDEATGYYNRVYSRAAGDLRLPGAKEYCRDLVEGGFEDWRLPTKEETAVAASHQMSSYVSMRIGTADSWNRWAGPEFTRGRDLYAYFVRLGTGTATAVVARAKNGTYPSAGDTICVRTP